MDINLNNRIKINLKHMDINLLMSLKLNKNFITSNSCKLIGDVLEKS